MDMDFATIRRRTIIALFSDDELAGIPALKGGNALSLVQGITSRNLVDIDRTGFSGLSARQGAHLLRAEEPVRFSRLCRVR
jgi:hypothetical protein